MTCRFRKLEPSLSSMKEKSLESRRVRTQPCTNIGATGAVSFNAFLTEVGDGMAEGGRSDGHTQALARHLSAVVAPKLEGMIFPRIPDLALRVRLSPWERIEVGHDHRL